MKKVLFLLTFALLPMSAYADAQVENHPQTVSENSSEDYRVSYEDDLVVIDDLKSWNDLRAAGVPEEEMRTCIVRILNKSKFKYAKYWGDWYHKMTIAYEEVSKKRGICYRRGCLTKSSVFMEYLYYPKRHRDDDERIPRRLWSSVDSHTVCKKGRTYRFKTLGKNTIKLE